MANNISSNYSWYINCNAFNYLHKKKKLDQKLKYGREVTEKEKIRVYLDNINEKFRAKRK